MQYFGGKSRLAQPISQVINKLLLPNQTYVEAFCGSCNVISLVDPHRIRIANDLHYNLIQMWQQAQLDMSEFPDCVSQEQYYQIKAQGPDWLKGFVGFGCSFAGKYWHGYARNSQGTNYAARSRRSLWKKIQFLGDVQFSNTSYDQIPLHPQSLIYCDPPYANATGYSTGKFDHSRFLHWCEKMAQEGHTVLVSEYADNIPQDWGTIWSKQSSKAIRNNQNKCESTLEVLASPNTNIAFIV